MRKISFFLIVSHALTSGGQFASAQVKKNTEPISSTQASPIINISYKGVISVSNTKKDRLLWYQGNKINDSMLVTTDAKLVLYSKRRDMVIVQVGAVGKDPALAIVKELSRNEEKKKAFYDRISARKTSVMLYPLIVNTLYEFDAVKLQYENLVKNTIALPAVVDANAYKTFSAGGKAASVSLLTSRIPGYVQKAYDDLMSKVKNYPSIDFPAPPTEDFGSCFSGNCDSNARKDTEDNESEWLSSFTRYEGDVIRNAMSLMKTLNQLTLDTDADALTMIPGIQKAMEFAQNRINNKIDLLVRKHGGDITRLSAIVRAVIAAERQKELIGVSADNSYGRSMTKLLTLFDGFDKYLQQQMDARNYEVVLNLPFLIGIERQRQLLGGNGDKTAEYMDRINAFNRFQLDMSMDYNGSWKDCGRMQENLFADNKYDVFVSMGMVDCKFRFFLSEESVKHDPNYHFAKRFHLALTVRSGTTQEAISTDEENCTRESHDMTGIDVRPAAPFITISFCKDADEDTLKVFSLHLPVSRENRIDKRYGFWHLSTFDKYMQYDGWNERDPPTDLQMQLEEVDHAYKLQASKAAVKPDLEQMEEHYFTTVHREYLLKALDDDEERGAPTVALFNASNGDEVLLDETVVKKYKGRGDDADDDGEATFRVKVKITHAPLPYKKN